MQRNTTIRDRHRQTIRRGEPPCYWCGQPIDYQLRHPHPDSYVVDHKIPLAAGGTDTLDNKVPSHRSCNASKADKPYPTGIIRRSNSLNW